MSRRTINRPLNAGEVMFAYAPKKRSRKPMKDRLNYRKKKRAMARASARANR